MRSLERSRVENARGSSKVVAGNEVDGIGGAALQVGDVSSTDNRGRDAVVLLHGHVDEDLGRYDDKGGRPKISDLAGEVSSIAVDGVSEEDNRSAVCGGVCNRDGEGRCDEARNQPLDGVEEDNQLRRAELVLKEQVLGARSMEVD